MQNQVRYDNLWLRNRCQPIFQLFVTEDLSFDQYVNTCQLYGQPTRRHDGEYLCHISRLKLKNIIRDGGITTKTVFTSFTMFTLFWCSIINIFWPIELNDLWSKKICRPKIIVWSGTFILWWSCLIYNIAPKVLALPQQIPVLVNVPPPFARQAAPPVTRRISAQGTFCWLCTDFRL